MQPNEYYSLIVSSEGGHWNQAEGSTPKGRFHFCSVEPVIGRFSPLNDTVELSLKQFPAIFACETRSDPPTPAYVGRITKVEHRTDTYYLHFERDYSVDPISQEKLLAMAEALDIHKPHRGLGDLDSTHWSVKQVDLYRVLVRNGLVRPPAQPTAALSEVATGIGHPLAVQQERIVRLPAGAVSTAAGAAALLQQTAPAGAPGPASAWPSAPAVAAHRPRVFIVHGHNREAKFEVQALLGRLGLEGVILDEQSGRGETIIEKFEREAADVAFAVVLLTPDDQGGVATATLDALKPRARQNVILELGYFAAKLGRGRVCALRQGAVEIPSDYNGVQYLDYDAAGAWKTAIARELRDAGLRVDMNRL